MVELHWVTMTTFIALQLVIWIPFTTIKGLTSTERIAYPLLLVGSITFASSLSLLLKSRRILLQITTVAFEQKESVPKKDPQPDGNHDFADIEKRAVDAFDKTKRESEKKLDSNEKKEEKDEKMENEKKVGTPKIEHENKLGNMTEIIIEQPYVL